MKLILPLCLFLVSLTLTHPLSAQDRRVALSSERVESFDSSAEATLLTQLENFVDVAEIYGNLALIGAANECDVYIMVMRMADTITMSDFDHALAQAGNSNLPPGVGEKLSSKAAQVQSLIDEARDSNCFSANNQCCERNDDPLQSDRCITRSGSTCKVKGVRVKGCSKSSSIC